MNHYRFFKSYKFFIFCAIAMRVSLAADILSGSHLILKFSGVWNTRIIYS